jgi:putative nucleotidyltransferase with HDIG domain
MVPISQQIPAVDSALGAGRTLTGPRNRVAPERRRSRDRETFQRRLRQTYLESTRALVAAVEAKDPYTERHSLAVSHYAEVIGARLDLPLDQIETLKTAAILHDIGKIGVPDAILQKPGPLTPGEFAIVQKHPQLAAQILGHVSFLAVEVRLILHHHERYDGTGYPDGLRGDQIPYGARILATADALETMFSPRSYKPGYDIDRVRTELTSRAGSQFDPQIAREVVNWLRDLPVVLVAGSRSAPPIGQAASA